jgi:hypothetical protein
MFQGHFTEAYRNQGLLTSNCFPFNQFSAKGPHPADPKDKTHSKIGQSVVLLK